MYHVRFLKAPSFNYISLKAVSTARTKKKAAVTATDPGKFHISKQVKDHTLSVNSVISISNDLGEELFYGDVNLKVSVLLQASSQLASTMSDGVNLNTAMASTKEYSWTASTRSIQLSFEIPIADLYEKLQQLKAQNKSFKKGQKMEPPMDIFAVLRVEVIDPKDVHDALHQDMDEIIDEAYRSFEDAIYSSKTIYQSDTFRFLNVQSAPFQILSGGHYETLPTYTSSERYCLRTLCTSSPGGYSHTEWLPSSFKYQTSAIDIIEELGNGIERHLWNGGIHTINLLPSLMSLIQGLNPCGNFLELGTGVGVVSIAMSKLFPNSKVLATDLEDAAEMCEKNLHLNRSAATFKTLEWATQEKCQYIPDGWDIIIVTDCTYNPSYYDDLINVMRREASEKTTIVLAHKIREPLGEKTFFEKLKFHFRAVDGVWIHSLYESVHIGFYRKKP